jgi:hypothetical protein
MEYNNQSFTLPTILGGSKVLTLPTILGGSKVLILPTILGGSKDCFPGSGTLVCSFSVRETPMEITLYKGSRLPACFSSNAFICTFLPPNNEGKNATLPVHKEY